MGQTENKNSYSESFKDIKVGFLLFKENWHEFLLTEIIGLSLIFTFLFMSNFVLFSSGPFMLPAKGIVISKAQIEQRVPIRFITEQPFSFSPVFIQISFFITLLGILVLYTYLATDFGLAHDIFNSGDQFTEFSNSFQYFKKNFFKYCFITFSVVFISVLGLLLDINLTNGEIVAEYGILKLLPIFFLQMVLFISLSMVFTGVTAGNGIIQSFKENFQIFVKNAKRFVFTWLLFIVIFSIPAYVAFFIFIRPWIILFNPLLLLSGSLFLILNLTSLMLVFPLMSLISTRIYVTSKY